MPAYQWYKTHETTGTTDQASDLVDVWFDTTPPPDPSQYDLVIIDSDGDGGISPSEWQATTGNAGTKARGPNPNGELILFDPDPAGGPTDGFIYSSEPIPVGTTGLLSGLIKNFAPVNPGDLEPPIDCFLRGTRIETPQGPRAVEQLREGDLVVTRDRGAVRVRAVWAGRFAGYGDYAPVRIETGVLGNAAPLYVSQNHRMLVTGAGVELAFGLSEALVMAKSLVGAPGITRNEQAYVRYHHLKFEHHELIYAEGTAAESYFTGNFRAARQAAQFDQDQMFGSVEDHGAAAQTCRPCLTHREGQLLAKMGHWSGVAMSRALEDA